MQLRSADCWWICCVVATCCHGFAPSLPAEHVDDAAKGRPATTAERDRLWKQARSLGEKGQVQEAAAIGEQVLAWNRKLFEADHEDVLSTLDWLATQYQLSHQLDAARRCAGERLDIYRRQDPESWQTVSAQWRMDYLQKLSEVEPATLQSILQLEKQAIVFSAAEQERRALRQMQELQPLELRALGAEHPFLANNHASQARLLLNLNEFQAAEAQAARSLKIRQKQLGEKHPETAMAAWMLGLSLIGQSKNKEALEPLELAETAWKASRQHANAAWAASRQADCLVGLRRLEEAKDSVRESASGFRRASLEEAEKRQLEKLNILAVVTRDWDVVEACRQRQLELIAAELGPDHWRTKDAQLAVADVGVLRALPGADLQELNRTHQQSRQVEELRSKGRWKEAVGMTRVILKTRRRLLGNRHRQIAESLNLLAVVLFESGDHDEPEELYREVVEIRQEVSGTHHPDYAAALSNLAFFLAATGRYSEAEPLYRKVISLDRLIHGEKSEDLATSLNNLAQLYVDMGLFSQAEPLHRQALYLRRELLGEDHTDFAVSLNNLACLYQSLSDFERAMPLYQQALAVHERNFPADHPMVALSLNNLGGLYQVTGRYREAEPLFRRARDIRKKILGPDHPDYAASLNNLATVYREMGDYDKALAFQREAAAIERKTVGEDHPRYASTLTNLGLLQHARNDLAGAEASYRRALEIRRRALGEKHPDFATSLNNLSEILKKTGKQREAETLLKQALQIQLAKFGRQHPDVALSLHNLAAHYQEAGEFDQAERLLKQALEIRRDLLGKNHPDSAVTINNLAWLYRMKGDHKRAVPLAYEALALARRTLEDSASVLSERQQLALNWMLRSTLDDYLSVALDAGIDSTEPVREILRWKGETLLRQRASRVAQAAAADTQTEQARRDIELLTQEMAALKRAPGPDIVAWKRRMLELSDRKETLEAEYGRRSRLENNPDDNFELAEVLQALPENCILVDYLQFVRSRRAETGQWEAEDSYLVSINARGKTPILIELGSGDSLAELIEKWRSDFGASSESIKAGLQLRRRVWQPVERHLARLLPANDGSSSRPRPQPLILVATDGVLSRFPLAALPGRRDGTWLIEDHRLAYVPVPRLIPELSSRQQTEPEIQSVLLVGDVDFGVNSQGQSVPWTPLPGAAREMTALHHHYRTRKPNQTTVSVLRGKEATEQHVKDQLSEHQIIHLATHGVFVEKKEPVGSQAGLFATRRGATLLTNRPGTSEGSLPRTVTVVRSGIVLAGANQLSERTGRSASHSGAMRRLSRDDGLLMADELLTLPLQHASLVVLSACDTGQGKRHSGEGLLGIQRAFQVAGAGSTVASLWKVDDLATQVLMEQFHQNLQRHGSTRLDALRDAQLLLLKTGRKGLRDAARAASDAGSEIRGASLTLSELKSLPDDRLPPFYWAAFGLSGDWR